MRATMNSIRAATFAVATGLLAQFPAHAAILATPQATILAYETALNGGDATGATSLFTADAVLLQDGNPPVVGSADILSSRASPPARPGPFSEHLPLERIVAPGSAACACGGGTRLSKLGEDVTESLEAIPRQWKVIQHVREMMTVPIPESRP